MAVKPLNLDALEEASSSLYEAIVIMGKRARQINEELKIQYNQRVEQLAAQPIGDSEEGEEGVNPDQVRISVEFEKLPKPSDLSIDEFLQGKVVYRYKEVNNEV
jgi:DNA-directed RNA polymerase subunit K/omega